MNERQARGLQIGDRVHWDGDLDAANGTVSEVGYNAFKVAWDDGSAGIFHFKDNEAQLIHIRKRRLNWAA